MLVVSDASPLNILIRIGNVEILQSLFTTVILPTAVAEELTRLGTPAIVREWISSRPTWLRIQTPKVHTDPIEIRHRREREAINLALELKADLLLVDEPRPRRAATSLGIPVIGTIGILERAAMEKLIDLDSAFARLRNTDFFVSEKLLTEAAKRHHARLAGKPPTAKSE